MDILYRIISRFRQSLFLLLYLILSMLLMLSSDSELVEGIRTAGLETFGIIQEGFDSMTSYFSLRERNRELRKTNTALALENAQLQDALLENIRLRKLLQFKYEVDYNLIPAKVIGFSPQDFVSGLMLSVEGMKNIEKNLAVMTSEGLVGKVVKVSPHYAICQILMDPNSRVSGRIQRNRELGIISWDGGNSLKLDHVPNTITVLTGDVVLTSGYSQIYPPGLKIGVVTKVQKKDEHLFQEITVRPAVNFNRLEEVFILEAKETDELRD